MTLIFVKCSAVNNLNIQDLYGKDLSKVILWNNKFIRVGDLISNKNELIIESEFRVLHLSPLDGFRLFSLIEALPTQWRDSLETCISTGDTPFNLSDEIKLRWSGQIVLLEKVSYLHQSCPGSYAKWWRNLAASSGWRIQARDAIGWDGVGRDKNKPPERRAMTWRAGKARCMAA